MKKYLSMLLTCLIVMQCCMVLVIPTGATNNSIEITSPTTDYISKSSFKYVRWEDVDDAVEYKITIINFNTGDLLTERNLSVGSKTKYNISDILKSDTAYRFFKIWIGAYDVDGNCIAQGIAYATEAEAPDITCIGESNVTSDGVTLKMTIDRNYGCAIIDAGFYIGTSSKFSSATQYSFHDYGPSNVANSGTLTMKVTDLEPDTKYYYWAYAENDLDKTTSDRDYFWTDDCPHNDGVYTSPESITYVDIDDATQHKEIWLCDERCNKCYEVVNTEAVTEIYYREHTWVNDVCKYCGYALVCQHNDTYNEYYETTYGDITETTHTRYEFYHVICDDCGEQLDGYDWDTYKNEKHTFKNDVCTKCGYQKSAAATLTLKVSISKTEAVVGEYVSVTPQATGGAGEYKYSYYVYENGVEVNSHTSEPSYGYTAKNVGELYFKVTVVDADGSIVTVDSDVITVTEDTSAIPEVTDIQIYAPSEDEWIDRLDPPNLKWATIQAAEAYWVSIYDASGVCLSTTKCTNNTMSLSDKFPTAAFYYQIEIYAYDNNGDKVAFGSTYCYANAEKPIVSTGGATNSTVHSIELSMSVIRNGGSTITESGFYVGKSADTLTDKYRIADIIEKGEYSLTIDDLEEDAVYYYQAYAVNEMGEGRGNVYTFSTSLSPMQLVVSPTVLTFAGNAGDDTVSVNSDGDWEVTIPEGDDWILVNRQYGYANKTIRISVTQNDTSVPRSGIVEVTDDTGSETIIINQSGDVVSTLKVDTENISVGADKVVVETIQISSNDGWNVTSKASWIAPSVGYGRFDEIISLTIQANTSSVQRTGQVEIVCGDITHTITVMQKAPSRPCIQGFVNAYTVTVNEKFDLQGIVSAIDGGKLEKITIRSLDDVDFGVSVYPQNAETYDLSNLTSFDTAAQPIYSTTGTYTYAIFATASNFKIAENEIGRFTVTVNEIPLEDAKVSLSSVTASATSVTVKGKIDTLGSYAFEECGVILYDATKTQIDKISIREYPQNNSKIFTAQFTKLTPNTNYYAKCYLIAGGNTYYYPSNSNYVSLSTENCTALEDMEVDPYGAYKTTSTVDNGLMTTVNREFTLTLHTTPTNAFVSGYKMSHNGGSSVSCVLKDNQYQITINETGTYQFTFEAYNEISSITKTIEVLVTEDDGMIQFIFPSSSNRDINTGTSNYYSDELFAGSSYDGYNHDLAKIALGLAVSAYTADISYYGEVSTDPNDTTYAEYLKRIENIAYAYEQIGVSQNSIEYILYDESLNSAENNVAYSIGKKVTSIDGEPATLIFVVLRGGEYGAEWASNFDVGSSGDFSKAFDGAARHVYDHVTAYIEELPSSQSKSIKVLITGYSRSAATANIAAARLNEWAMNNYKIAPKDIYAYTFATPNSVQKEYLKNKLDEYGTIYYNNIHNIVNPADVVPTVPLSQWGFTKFGITHYFSEDIENEMYPSTGDHSNLLYVYNKVDDMFDTYNTDSSIYSLDTYENLGYEQSVWLLGRLLSNITTVYGDDGRNNFDETLRLPIQKFLHITNSKSALATDPDKWQNNDILKYIVDYYPSEIETIKNV